MTSKSVLAFSVVLLVEPAAAEPLADVVERLRRQVEALQEQVKQQQIVIDDLKAGHTVAKAPPPPPEPVRSDWSPAQPVTLLRGGHSYMNLSLDLLTDAGWSTNPDVPLFEPGDHDPNQRGFSLPNAELALDGAVDPYFRAFANVVFKLDESNETEVELEEAYGLTTALPWNLQMKAGQFLTEFGRINQQHPHAWDFVDVPLVSARVLGAEGLRNPGARLSWLLPVPFYSELIGTIQNSQGSTAASFRNVDTPTLFGRTAIDRGVASPADLLYSPRWVSSFDLTEAQTLVAGVSGGFGPNDSGPGETTQLYGADVYWKWKPSWQSGGFPFVAVQGEAMGRRYSAPATPSLPSQVLSDYGAYGQVTYGFHPRWIAGLRYDWVTGQQEAFTPGAPPNRMWRLSPNLTFHPTEFSKLRLQYNYADGRLQGTNSAVWLQLELLLGDHAAHKF